MANDDTAIEDAIKETESEVDYTKLEAGRIPHEVVVQTHAFTGLKNDISGLRANVQELTANNAALTAQLEAREKEADETDPDDYVTNKGLEAKLARERAALEKDKKAHAANELKSRQNISLATLKQSHTAEKMGEGLDADSVMSAVEGYLVRNEPELLTAALRKHNPAQAVYDLAVRYCPSLVARKTARHNAEILSKVKASGLNKLDFADGVDVSEHSGDLMKLLGMTDSDMDDAIERDEFNIDTS